MKLAYLILAHNNPKHLKNLIKALNSSNSTIFIHIDAKKDINEFLNLGKNNTFFLEKRTNVYWGEFSIVQATLLLLNPALSYNKKFDYFILISGTDYPLHSVIYIENFFLKNFGKEFINIVPMPCDQIGKPIRRLTHYKFQSKNTFNHALIKTFTLNGRLNLKRDYRLSLGNLVPYAGSQWWALTNSACIFILKFIEKNKQFVDFYVNTHIPDESFFHTIIGNSHFLKKVTHNLTYTDWSCPKKPAEMNEKHFELFQSNFSIIKKDIYGEGELLFARKFSDKNEELILKLDQLRIKKEQSWINSSNNSY